MRHLEKKHPLTADAAHSRDGNRRSQWLLVCLLRWTLQVGVVGGVALAGVSWPAVAVLSASTLTGVLGLSISYHRYFAHRAFATSRFFQFLLACWGATSLQRGPLWWAAVHRHHHQHADTDQDWHTPKHGLWHAHTGWLLSPRILDVQYANIGDFARYPELRFIDRFFVLPAVVMIFFLWVFGVWLRNANPAYEAAPAQMVVWGFFVRTMLVGQIVFSVNSVLHRWGRRRYETRDNSRNSWWLGLLTCGDGFHNNHHRFASSARHGFYWWEVDLTWYVIEVFGWVGLVHGIRLPTAAILLEGRSAPS